MFKRLAKLFWHLATFILKVIALAGVIVKAVTMPVIAVLYIVFRTVVGFALVVKDILEMIELLNKRVEKEVGTSD